MITRRITGAFMLLALAACNHPSLNDADAQKAVKDIPGVVSAVADCTNPLDGGPACALVVNLEPDLDAKKISTILDKAKPALVDDVYDVRIVTGAVSLSLNVGRYDVKDISVDEFVTMRDHDHVAKGTIEVRGSGAYVVVAETDSFDAGLDIATALRSDEITDVTVTGARLQLKVATGLPEAEFAFAKQIPNDFKGVSRVNVEPGVVIFYCTGAKVQAAVKAKVSTLPGYSDIAEVDVFQDAP